MSKEEVLERIRATGVMPVIRASSSEEAASVVDAVAAGGIEVIELTMTVPGAIELIGNLTSRRPDLLIGAGTVLDPETARDCINAGAEFIVSPATNFDTIQYCNDLEKVVMPGALTPTEVVNAWDAGADVVKVFPANALGGASYIRSLKAPLPDVKIIPTGGVNLANATEMIRAGAEAIGVGAELVDLKAIREGTPEVITEAARSYLAAVAAGRADRTE